MTYEEVVRLLVETTTERGMSQSDLAREIGVKQAAVSQWFGGQKRPKLEHLRTWADLVDMKVLLNLTPKDAPPHAEELLARAALVPPERAARALDLLKVLAGVESERELRALYAVMTSHLDDLEKDRPMRRATDRRAS